MAYWAELYFSKEDFNSSYACFVYSKVFLAFYAALLAFSAASAYAFQDLYIA